MSGGLRAPLAAHWALLAVVALSGAVLHLTHPGVVRSLAREDGLLEVTQAVLYLGAAVVCVVGLARRVASRWAYAVAAGSLLLCGEEISWGQRLLGFEVPEPVAATNRQHEFNVHNLPGVNESIRDIGVVLGLTVFLALPVLARRSGALRRVIDQFGIVLGGATCAVAAAVAIAYMRIPRWLGANDYGYDEWGELFLAWTVLAYALTVAGLIRWQEVSEGERLTA